MRIDEMLTVQGMHDDLMDQIGRLRQLLIDTPVLIIDERAARLLGEDKALQYMEALRKWHPQVQAALKVEDE